jgi:hypothetical protein
VSGDGVDGSSAAKVEENQLLMGIHLVVNQIFYWMKYIFFSLKTNYVFFISQAHSYGFAMFVSYTSIKSFGFFICAHGTYITILDLPSSRGARHINAIEYVCILERSTRARQQNVNMDYCPFEN